MWKQKIFSEHKSFFWSSNMKENEKILDAAMNKALDWINTNNINEFKITHNLMSYGYGGSPIHATVTVVYNE